MSEEFQREQVPRRRGTGRRIEPFLGHLESVRHQRGVMADLRHGFSKTTGYRAWPHVAPFCVDFRDDRERAIMLVIAAGFALHGRTAFAGNMGAALRALSVGSGQRQKALETFDGRFRRLLSCATAIEVCDRLPGVLRATERNGIPIDFAQLYEDLWHWGEHVKVRWARAFWGGAADAGDPQQALEGQGAQ